MSAQLDQRKVSTSSSEVTVSAPVRLLTQEELMAAHTAYHEAVKVASGNPQRHIGTWYMKELLLSRPKEEVDAILKWHEIHDDLPDPMLVQERYLVRSGCSPTELLWMWELYRNGTLSVTDLILGMADRGVELNETQCQELITRLLSFTGSDGTQKISPEKFASGLKRYTPLVAGSNFLSGARPLPGIMMPGRLPLGRLPQQQHLPQRRASEANQERNEKGAVSREEPDVIDESETDSDADNELDEERRSRAVTTIAAHYRGHLARRTARNMRLEAEIHTKRNSAATLIAATYRGHQARSKVQQMRDERAMELRQHAAATQIAAHYRGYRARQFSKRMRIDREVEMARACAVTSIAAQYRGYRARKEFMRLRQEKRAHDKKRASAATKIAATYRGHRARVDVAKRRAEYTRAATTISAHYRGFKDRQLVRALRQELKAANEAKDVHKKRNSMDPTAVQRSAVTTIAAHYRGYAARKQYEDLKATRSASARDRAIAALDQPIKAKQKRNTIPVNDTPVDKPNQQDDVKDLSSSGRDTEVEVNTITDDSEAVASTVISEEVANDEKEQVPEPAQEPKMDELSLETREVEIQTELEDSASFEEHAREIALQTDPDIADSSPGKDPTTRRESLIDYLERRVSELENDSLLADPTFEVVIRERVPGIRADIAEVTEPDVVKRIDGRLSLYEAAIPADGLPPPPSVVPDKEWYSSAGKITTYDQMLPTVSPTVKPTKSQDVSEHEVRRYFLNQRQRQLHENKRHSMDTRAKKAESNDTQAATYGIEPRGSESLTESTLYSTSMEAYDMFLSRNLENQIRRSHDFHSAGESSSRQIEERRGSEHISPRMRYDKERRKSMLEDKERRASQRELRRIEGQIGAFTAAIQQQQWSNERISILARRRRERIQRQADLHERAQKVLQEGQIAKQQERHETSSSAATPAEVVVHQPSKTHSRETLNNSEIQTRTQSSMNKGKSLLSGDPRESLKDKLSVYERSQQGIDRKEKWIQERKNSADRRYRDTYTFKPEINKGANRRRSSSSTVSSTTSTSSTRDYANITQYQLKDQLHSSSLKNAVPSKRKIQPHISKRSENSIDSVDTLLQQQVPIAVSGNHRHRNIIAYNQSLVASSTELDLLHFT